MYIIKEALYRHTSKDYRRPLNGVTHLMSRTSMHTVVFVFVQDFCTILHRIREFGLTRGNIGSCHSLARR